MAFVVYCPSFLIPLDFLSFLKKFLDSLHSFSFVFVSFNFLGFLFAFCYRFYVSVLSILMNIYSR